MELRTVIDFLLHLNVHLDTLVQNYGAWVYLLLFLTVFCETGLVVTPFLPGDSLLFAVGALCGTGALDLVTSIALLLGAAIMGDTANYWIGSWVGPKVFRRAHSRWLNPAHLRRAHEFSERYGGKAVVLARFAPIIRTYVPFVAGIGRITYLRFMLYNVFGGVAWVWGFVLLGFFFGSWPLVQRHFSIIILGIVIVSLLPFILHALPRRRAPGTLEREGVAPPGPVLPLLAKDGMSEAAESGWDLKAHTLESMNLRKLITAILYAGPIGGASCGIFWGYRDAGWSGIPQALMLMSLVGGIAVWPLAGAVWVLGALVTRLSRSSTARRRADQP